VAIRGEPSLKPKACARWPLVLGLWIATVAVYGQVIGFDFLNYDDDALVYENPGLADPSLANMAVFWTSAYYKAYEPVTLSWLSVTAAVARSQRVFGHTHLDPAVFHAGSLLLHLACVTCVFLLLGRLVGSRTGAFFGALLFALHPLQTDSVAWISNTKGLLGALFGLCSLAFYLARRDGSPRPRLRYALALVCFALALLAKPTKAMVPLAFIAIDVIMKRTPWRRALAAAAPFFALSLITSVLALSIDEHTTAIQLWQRPLVAGTAVSFYVGKMLWPLSLAPDYGLGAAKVLSSHWYIPVGLLPYLAAGFLVWRRNRLLILAAAVFLAGSATVIGLVPFTYQFTSIVADRYIYFSMLAPALVLALLIARYPTRGLKVAAAVVLVVAGALSAAQAAHWRDSRTLYAHTLSVNPQSWVSHNNLGLVYRDAGQMDEAIAHFQQALAIRPIYPEGHNNLAMALASAGRIDEAEAHVQEAIRQDPDDARSYSNLAGLLASTGHRTEAIAHLRKALTLSPSLANLHYNLGLLLLQEGNAAEAAPALETAVRLRPDVAAWQMTRAAALARLGDRSLAATTAAVSGH
jgi:tetratricopeptide (TPR) repeat protein